MATDSQALSNEALSALAAHDRGVERLVTRYRSLQYAIGLAGQATGGNVRELEKLRSKLLSVQSAQDKLNASRKRTQDLAEDNYWIATANTAALEMYNSTIVKAIKLGVSSDTQLRNIRNTAGLSAESAELLGSKMRDASQSWNQSIGDMRAGMQTLVDGGMHGEAVLIGFQDSIAKGATATGKSVIELSAAALALNEGFKLDSKQFDATIGSWIILADQGRMSIADLVTEGTKVASSLNGQGAHKLGFGGQAGAADVGVGLELARKGAGSSEDASKQYQQFLKEMMAPEMFDTFKKAGIDLEARLKSLRENGLTPLQAVLKANEEYANKVGKGPLKGDDAKAFAKTAKDNGEDLASMSKAAHAPGGGAQALDNAAGANLEGTGEKLKALTNGLEGLGESIGKALLPILDRLLDWINPFVQLLDKMVVAYPGLTASVIGAVGAVAAFGIAFKMARLGYVIIKSSFADLLLLAAKGPTVFGKLSRSLTPGGGGGSGTGGGFESCCGGGQGRGKRGGKGSRKGRGGRPGGAQKAPKRPPVPAPRKPPMPRVPSVPAASKGLSGIGSMVKNLLPKNIAPVASKVAPMLSKVAPMLSKLAPMASKVAPMALRVGLGAARFLVPGLGQAALAFEAAKFAYDNSDAIKKYAGKAANLVSGGLAKTQEALGAKSAQPAPPPAPPVTVQFNPTINVQHVPAKGTLKELLGPSLYELEKLIERVVDQQARLSYNK